MKKDKFVKLLKIKEQEIIAINELKDGDWDVITEKGTFLVCKDMGSFYKYPTCGSIAGRNDTGHFLPASSVGFH